MSPLRGFIFLGTFFYTDVEEIRRKGNALSKTPSKYPKQKPPPRLKVNNAQSVLQSAIQTTNNRQLITDCRLLMAIPYFSCVSDLFLIELPIKSTIGENIKDGNVWHFQK